MPREGQADAKSCGRAIERRIGLREHLEDARQEIGGDADAVISYLHDGSPTPFFRAHPHMAVAWCKFDRIGEKVRHDLDEAGRIPVHDKCRVGQHDVHVKMLQFDGRRAGFHRLCDRVAQVDGSLLQRDLAEHDPVHVQDLIEKARLIPRLPFDDLSRAFMAWL